MNALRLPDWVFVLLGQLVVSAVALAFALWMLWLAMGIYVWCLERFIRTLGLRAALIEFCREKCNHKTRWYKTLNWSMVGWRNR
jgi:hypothetical protein